MLPSFYQQRGGAWSVENGWLEETSSGNGRIVRVDVPEDLESFRFSYQSQQVVEDFDGDPATENKYGPEYYALALMKVFQREPVAPAVVGEYEYIALVMTPNEIALREWSGDTVTDLASEAVDSVKGVWYDITVAWDGAELTVSRGLSGGALAELFTAETTLENDSTDIGFGVGEKAEYRFDEVRLSSPSLSAEEPSKLTEYIYDALGRRVGVTDYTGASARTTRYPPAADLGQRPLSAAGGSWPWRMGALKALVDSESLSGAALRAGCCRSGGRVFGDSWLCQSRDSGLECWGISIRLYSPRAARVRSNNP